MRSVKIVSKRRRGSGRCRCVWRLVWYPGDRCIIHDLTVMLAVGLALLFTADEARVRAAEQGFEVASIRPSDSEAPGHPIQMGPTIFDTRHATLKDLIRVAYKVQGYQITGGPEWIDSVRYDVRAKAESPASPDQIRGMLALLLRERFRLRVHNASESMAVYALTVSRKGSKLQTPKEGTPRDGPGAIQTDASGVIARGSTMGLFAGFLSRELDRPVLDGTGFTGSYNFRLRYDESNAPDSSTDLFGIISSALSDVGLRLESRKADVPVLMVDSAEHPSPN